MKRQILASLHNICNQLETNGFVREASALTKVMIKVADEFNPEGEMEMSEEPTRDMSSFDNVRRALQMEDESFPVRFRLVTETEAKNMGKDPNTYYVVVSGPGVKEIFDADENDEAFGSVPQPWNRIDAEKEQMSAKRNMMQFKRRMQNPVSYSPDDREMRDFELRREIKPSR